jgi:hypothetical protein
VRHKDALARDNELRDVAALRQSNASINPAGQSISALPQHDDKTPPFHSEV